MNAKIVALKKKGDLGAKTKLVSLREIHLFFAILFGAHTYGGGGERLWDTDEKNYGIDGAPNFGLKYGMKLYRFDQIKRVFPFFFTHSSLTEEQDPWFMIQYAVDKFNQNRKQTICASRNITVDESMSPFRPRTTKTGKGNESLGMPDLPHLSFIQRKPKPLGTEFKTAACAERRFHLHIEIQRGKDGMRDLKYASELGAQAGCAIRLLEEAAGCGRNPEDVKASLLSASVELFVGILLLSGQDSSSNS